MDVDVDIDVKLTTLTRYRNTLSMKAYVYTPTQINITTGFSIMRSVNSEDALKIFALKPTSKTVDMAVEPFKTFSVKSQVVVTRKLEKSIIIDAEYTTAETALEILEIAQT